MPLTATGYNAPDITELVENMSTNNRTFFGPLIDTSADSVLGHITGVTSIEIVKVFEDLIEFHSNLNANTAEGRMLENICLIGGIVKKDKAFSTGVVEFTGPASTVIPIATVLPVEGDDTRRFVTRLEATIAPAGTVSVQVVAEVQGALAAPAGTLINFETDIPDVTVSNNTDITLGTDDIESDSQLRSRRNNTLSVGGNGTPAAIRAALEQIDGVTAARVINNPTHSYVPRGDGIYQRPPHSIECVVEGGDELTIVETIALTRSATSDSFGLLMAFYQDVVGNAHQIRFSRPTILELEVEVIYSLYSEEAFPEDGEGRMAEKLIEFADLEYVLGKDVLRDRLYEPVLQVRGISTIEIRVGIAGQDNLGEGNISAEEYERVNLSAANITITKKS